jgi:hypothetical protein
MMWLDRTLLVGPHLALVTNEEEILALTKEVDVDPPAHWCGSDKWHACTHTWQVGAELICIVAINMEYAKEMPATHVAALLVHEATHVWQEVREKIGGNIGDESEAYAMQNICRELFDAYAKKLGDMK